MSNHHLGHAVKGGVEVVKHMTPLAERKNPALAFVLGLLFGALGVALYFKSAKDFFVCLGMLILLTIIIPGLGAVPGWLFAPVYGAWRAHTSNENAGH